MKNNQLVKRIEKTKKKKTKVNEQGISCLKVNSYSILGNPSHCYLNYSIT